MFCDYSLSHNQSRSESPSPRSRSRDGRRRGGHSGSSPRRDRSPSPPFSVHQYAQEADLKHGLPFKVMSINGQIDIRQHNMSADILISHACNTPRFMTSTQVVREMEYLLGSDSHGCQVHSLSLYFSSVVFFS